MVPDGTAPTLPFAVGRATLGNVETFACGSRTIEYIRIASDDLAKRVLRLRGREREIGLRLENESRLRDGDVVYADDDHVIAIKVDPDDVLVCRPRGIGEAARVAHALGNRHLPLQVHGDTIVVRYDSLLETLFSELGAPHERVMRVLGAPFRHADAPHGHA